MHYCRSSRISENIYLMIYVIVIIGTIALGYACHVLLHELSDVPSTNITNFVEKPQYFCDLKHRQPLRFRPRTAAVLTNRGSEYWILVGWAFVSEPALKQYFVCDWIWPNKAPLNPDNLAYWLEGEDVTRDNIVYWLTVSSCDLCLLMCVTKFPSVRILIYKTVVLRVTYFMNEDGVFTVHSGVCVYVNRERHWIQVYETHGRMNDLAEPR